jgi:hypothetical protein
MARLRIALMVVLLPACGPSPSRQAADATHELRSWDSTARLANTARARGAIPAGFAEQVRRAEGEGRATAEAKLRKAAAR